MFMMWLFMAFGAIIGGAAAGSVQKVILENFSNKVWRYHGTPLGERHLV
jgi:hypothetical protein